MGEVIIIGAGITGLSCAWRLRRLGIEPLVLESSSHAGGVIRSERIGEFLIERGPNSLLPTSETFTILDEAGLTSQIIEGDPKAPRYICLNGSLKKAPFEPMTFGGLLRAAAEPFIRSKSPKDESVSNFFVRRFGQQAQDRLVAPFVTGIYAGNTRELSMAATFPKLTAMERQYGSVVLGMMKSPRPKSARRGRTCSFVDGMGALPRRLASDANIIYECGKVTVDRDLNVDRQGGRTKAGAVIITAPTYRAVGIVEQSLPHVGRILENATYAPMISVTSFIADDAFPHPLHGFGFLVPRSEKLHILGTLFSSALFSGRAPEGKQLLTSFIGGAHEPEAIQWSDERVWETVQKELQTVLKTSRAPELIAITRYTHAIPQYKIGQEHWVAALKGELTCAPGLFFGGNYMEGISVASCIETGERIARETAAFMSSAS